MKTIKFVFVVCLLLSSLPVFAQSSIDDIVDLDAASYKSYRVIISTNNAVLNLEIEVLDGVSIDVLVLDEVNYNMFMQQIDEGYYQVNAIFARQDVYSVKSSISLGETGDYYIVIVNMHVVGDSRVHIKAHLETSSSILGGLIVLIFLIIVVIGIVYWKKIKK